jgi:uncharacterized protein YndB with AHSA1/START domain
LIRVAAFLLFTLLLGCSAVPSPGPADRLQTLAAQGQIQEDAPVKATAQITIHASPEKVWGLLTRIDDWPKWQATISAAKIDGPLQPGTRFTWTSGNAKIESRIALVRTNQQIGWTGTAFKAHAVHIWTLEPLPDGNTLVKTTESMDGFLLKLFYSSKDLAASHKVWLDALKRKAEE